MYFLPNSVSAFSLHSLINSMRLSAETTPVINLVILIWKTVLSSVSIATTMLSSSSLHHVHGHSKQQAHCSIPLCWTFKCVSVCSGFVLNSHITFQQPRSQEDAPGGLLVAVLKRSPRLLKVMIRAERKNKPNIMPIVNYVHKSCTLTYFRCRDASLSSTQNKATAKSK